MICVLCALIEAGAVALILFLFYHLLRWLLEMIPIGGHSSKPVLITGCDHGFGYALALRLLREGFPVYAGCLTEKGVENLQENSKHLPGRLDAFVMDVASDESVEKARQHVEDKEGGLWALVTNAGVMGEDVPDDWLQLDQYRRCMEVNTFGVIRCTHAFKNLIKRRQGRIVCVASICARCATATTGPYTTSKFAVQGYINTIRVELATFGVSVHTLEPGFFKTAILDEKKLTNDAHRIWESTDEETKAYYGNGYLESLIDIRNQCLNMLASHDIDPVINSFYSAIASRFPRLRYHPGFDSKFIFYPISLLPDFVLMLGTAYMTRDMKPPAKAVYKNPFSK